MKHFRLQFLFLLVFGSSILSLDLTSAQRLPERSEPRSLKQEVRPALGGSRGRDTDWHGQGWCDPLNTRTPNISGEYNNVVFYSNQNSIGEQGKLVIKKNNRDFELITASGIRRGSITATTSCGYTALALQFADVPNSKVVTLLGRKIGSAQGFNLESFVADKPIVLTTAEDESLDIALLICPETYPECWPWRKRCPCERP